MSCIDDEENECRKEIILAIVRTCEDKEKGYLTTNYAIGILKRTIEILESQVGQFPIRLLSDGDSPAKAMRKEVERELANKKV